MAVIICTDGLGGDPNVTFIKLMAPLQEDRHDVVLVNVEEIKTHEDRIQRVIEAFFRERDKGQDKIFLLGQSAGASAVRITAERLSGYKSLRGIIHLSGAMPFGINFMTKQLAQNMALHLPELAAGFDIYPTEVEYDRFIQPILEGERLPAIASRKTIPGHEARKLAFYPDGLGTHEYPILFVYGNKDQWISPRAHRKLYHMLDARKMRVEGLEIKGAGHLTLSSSGWENVIWNIRSFIERH